eukprot:714644-Prymnesium_polylepis.1
MPAGAASAWTAAHGARRAQPEPQRTGVSSGAPARCPSKERARAASRGPRRSSGKCATAGSALASRS